MSLNDLAPARGFSFARFLSALLIGTLCLSFPGPVSALRQPAAAESDPELVAGLEQALQAGPKATVQRIGRFARQLREGFAPTASPVGIPTYPAVLDYLSQNDSPNFIAGLEEVWPEVSKPIKFLRNATLRNEARAVLRLALSGQTAGGQPIVPPRVAAQLQDLPSDPESLQQRGRAALVEWMAQRWAYDRTDPEGQYHDTLAQMIRSSVRPTRSEQFLDQARSLGIPVDATPDNFTARKAGFILPLYAARSEQDEGIGDLAVLRQSIDWAASHGMQQVYLLPIWEIDWIDPSPYFTLSAFAGNPFYVALREVPEVQASREAQQLLGRLETDLNFLRDLNRMDYPTVMPFKLEVLKAAYEQFRDQVLGQDAERTQAFNAFRQRNAYWLDEYTTFRSLAQEYQVGWREYPEAYRDRNEAAIQRWRREHRNDVQFYEYIQFLFQEQFRAVANYAHQNNIRLVGDMPGGVDGDATWIFRESFAEDATAGAAADRYSVVMQDWGTQVPDWDRRRAFGYPLTMTRLRRYTDLFDDVRMDYWVGYASFFRIPKTADEAKWRRENLTELVEALRVAWNEKFAPEPFPLNSVEGADPFYKQVYADLMDPKLYPDPEGADQFDRQLFADSVVRILQDQGRYTWGPNEPRYQQFGWIRTDGTFDQLTSASDHPETAEIMVDRVVPELSDSPATREAVIKEFQRKGDVTLGPAGTRAERVGQKGDLELWVHFVMRALDSEWPDGPAHDVMQPAQQLVTYQRLGEMIPEDFGEGFPLAQRLRRELGLPRVRPLEFGLEGFFGSYWDTQNYHPNTYTFTTTHDGPTLMGQILTMARGDESQQSQLSRVVEALREEGIALDIPPDASVEQRAQGIHRGVMIKAARSQGRRVLYMYQDLLGLDNDFRTTPPGDALGEKWRDRMPVTLEDLLANQGDMAQRTNRLAADIMADPQARRSPTTASANQKLPVIAGMLPQKGNEDEVRVHQIRRKGEAVEAWAVVVPAANQREAGQEPVVRTALWGFGQTRQQARTAPMRLYSVLPDGTRLYYGQMPVDRAGQFVLTTEITDMTGSWHAFTGAYEEPTVVVLEAGATLRAPGAGLEELTLERLAQSVLHYRYGREQVTPEQQFELSTVAARLVSSIESGQDAEFHDFRALFNRLTDLVVNQDLSTILSDTSEWGGQLPPPITTSDLSRIFSDLLRYRWDLRERLYSYLVEIAVYYQDSSPAAMQLAVDLLRSAESGEIVIAALQSNFSTTSGGLGVYIRELTAGLARIGLNVTVVVPMFAADKGQIMRNYFPKDTGKSVNVQFITGDESREHAVVKLYDARTANGIRVVYLENEKYFPSLNGVYQGGAAYRLRVARVLSLGTLLAIRELKMHPSVIQSNDDFTSLIPLYLRQGEGGGNQQETRQDDVDMTIRFADDAALNDTQTVHVIHALAPGYPLQVDSSNHMDRDSKIYFDLGRDPSRPGTDALYHPIVPDAMAPLGGAIAYADRVVTVSRGFHQDSLQWTFTSQFDGFTGSLHGRSDKYMAIPNGFDTVSAQRRYFSGTFLEERTFLEMGERPDREAAAWRLFDEVTPNRKANLQEIFNLPQNPNAFVYSMLSRIEGTKGHHILTAPIWSRSDPGQLAYNRSAHHGFEHRTGAFEPMKTAGLNGEDQSRLSVYAQQTGQQTLTALEVALVLMPDLQVIVAGPSNGSGVNREVAQDLQGVSERYRLVDEAGHFAYHPRHVDPATDPRYELIYTGSTEFGSPSESESFGLAVLEALAGGVPTLHSMRGGLQDMEIVFPEIRSGFTPYHPVAWFQALRHHYSVYLFNQDLWNWFRYWAVAETDFRSQPKQYRSLYREIHQQRLHGGVIPDVHSDFELPALEMAAAINRAGVLGEPHPADELKRAGYSSLDAVNTMIGNLINSSNGDLVNVIISRYIPALDRVSEVRGHLHHEIKTTLDNSPNETVRERFERAYEAIYHKSWQGPAGGLEEAAQWIEAQYGAQTFGELALQAEQAAQIRQPVAILFEPSLLPAGSQEEQQVELIGLAGNIRELLNWPEDLPLELGLLNERVLMQQAGFQVIEVLRHPDSGLESVAWSAVPLIVTEALAAYQAQNRGYFWVNINLYGGMEQLSAPEVLAAIRHILEV